MIDKMKKFGLIAILLVVSFMISGFANKEAFIGNSPTIRPHLGSYIAMRVKTIIHPISTYIALLQGKDPSEVKIKSVAERNANLQSVPFSNIATGVAAREKEGVAEVRYDLNNIKWIRYSYTTRAGTKITIQVPEGQKPPPEGAL